MICLSVDNKSIYVLIIILLFVEFVRGIELRQVHFFRILLFYSLESFWALRAVRYSMLVAGDLFDWFILIILTVLTYFGRSWLFLISLGYLWWFLASYGQFSQFLVYFWSFWFSSFTSYPLILQLWSLETGPSHFSLFKTTNSKKNYNSFFK